MAIQVYFYTFSKRHNSTAIPSNALNTIDCNIKDESSVLNPALQLTFNPTTFNPTGYNYAYIPEFSRYYWVSDWTYISGFWECGLKVDVLASYKTQIGNSEKYVVRSSSRNNPLLIDTFYPASENEAEYIDSYDFGFSTSGDYVLGIINRQNTHIGGMTSFYRLNENNLEKLRRDMYPLAEESFTDISSFTGDVIRTLVEPFQYIVSCKKFPIPIPCDTIQSNLTFGGWTSDLSDAHGQRLLDINSWDILTHDFTIPNWLQLEAKYRSSPNAHIFITINPWGIIELSPIDFVSTNTVRLKIKTDFITGESLLEIYNVKGFIETLIAQRTATIGIDTAVSYNRGGAALGALQAGIGVAAGAGIAIASGGTLAAMGSGIATSSIGNAAETARPSMSHSIGTTGGFRSLEGIATLIVRYLNFVPDNNSEFGKPLCDTVILNTLTGYIKCADGDISCNGYDSELTEISEFLINGFYFE